MKSKLAIWTHQGMGDMIICNAIFRHYAKGYDLVSIPVKYPNTESVQYMLRDVPNISVRPIEDDEDGLFYLREVWMKQGGELLNLGWNTAVNSPLDFNQHFYRQAKLGFQLRWDWWRVERDPAIEVEVATSSYVFVHEDSKRGISIDLKRFNSNLPHVIPDLSISKNIFAYIPVLLRATEIHCIDSSFALLADSLALKPEQKLFIHRYARPSLTIPTYKLNWTILE